MHYTIGMKRLAYAALLAACFAAPAFAQDNRAEFARAVAAREYPAIFVFLDGLGGPWGEQAAAYAAASSRDPQTRAQEWHALNHLLRGGKRDGNGSHIRREMAKLPGNQWGVMAAVDGERRKIYGQLGWGPGGNITQSLAEGFNCQVTAKRCYDRTSQLMAAVKEKLERSPGWKVREVIANEVTDRMGMSDQQAMGYGMTHHAPCFIYEAPGVKAEIMADAWDNSMVPAYTWWYVFDKHTHDYLYKAGGRDWCGEKLISEAVEAEKAVLQAKEAASKAREGRFNQFLSPARNPF